MTRKSTRCNDCSVKLRNHLQGEGHPAWKGGRHIDLDGYVRIYMPEDPRANMGRYMKEHGVLMEAFLGRELLPDENVHHKNGDRADNRMENLELWSVKQPKGQRVEDKLEYAYQIIELYKDFHQPAEKV